MTDTFHATSTPPRSFARRRLGLLATLLALAAPASTQAQVIIRTAVDECIPSPEDGIFCGNEPGGFEIFVYFTQIIHGEITEPWHSANAEDDTFDYNRNGSNKRFFDYTLTEGSRLTIAGAGNMHYRGIIQGAGSLRLLAGGNLCFDRTDSFVYQRANAPHTAYYSRNTYSGGTEIAGGWLKIYDDASLGTGALTLSNGGRLQTLDTGSLRGFTLLGNDSVLQADHALSIDGVISGDGRLNTHGAGTVTLTQANTYAGGTHVAAGALAVSTDANLGAADTHVSLANNTTLVLGDGFVSSSRELALQDTSAQVAVANGSASWNGPTAGTGQLIKQGAGTLVLAGAIGHTGGADIATGTLEVAVSSTLGGTGTTTWSGPITGSGNLVKSGDGTLVLSGAATHSGATVVRGGTLETGAANVLSANSALFLIGGSTLNLAGHNQTVGDLDSYNPATQQVESSTVALGGATLTSLTRVINLWAGSLTGSGTLVKQGAAEMKWYAANSFAGEFRVDAGTASAQAATVFSPNATVTVASGATLQLNNHAQTIAGLAGTGNVALGSATLTLDQASDTTFSGAIAGTGGLTKSGSGTLTLTSANTYSGGTTLTFGKLVAGHASAFGTGTVRIHGGTLDLGNLAVNNALDVRGGSITGLANYTGTQTLSTAMTYSGSVGGTTIVAHDGFLNTTGATFTGATTVNAGGSLGGSGSLATLTLNSGATLTPGNSPGTLTITGDATWHGGANYEWEINNATGPAGTAHDLISISGTLTLTATSENRFTLSLVSLLANNTAGDVINFNAAQNYAYTIASASGGIIGFDANAFTLDTSGFANDLAGGTWSLAQSGNTLALNFTAAAIPEPGTYAAIFGALVLGLTIHRRRSAR